MTDLTESVGAFLDGSGWSGAEARPLAGDASTRRYLRLVRPDLSAILMVDSPGAQPGTMRFAALARHLRHLGFSAPEIIAEDHEQGLLLLEDLGDSLFSAVIDAGEADELRLYLAATDWLIALHRAPAPQMLSPFDAATMAEQTALIYDWYCPRTAASSDALDALQDRLGRLADLCSVMIHRDFHAQNLLWLPDRSGVAQVGVIDFQDALIGHPAYDLVSLTQDVRRDVSPKVAERITAEYCRKTETNPAEFAESLALLGLQRALRILGIFSRLAKRDNKPDYLGLMPRVWRHIETNLAHPSLSELASLIRATVPEPTDSRLAELKSQCRTAHTP